MYRRRQLYNNGILTLALRFNIILHHRRRINIK
jgi:hypothetical protein